MPTLKNFEVIDLERIGGGISNTVVLNAAKLIAMTDSRKTLRKGRLRDESGPDRKRVPGRDGVAALPA